MFESAMADAAQAHASPAPRIAVLVDREGLGDALLKVPFLRAIAHAYPGREVWWIATYQTSMAQELSPFVGTLIARTIENAGLGRPLRQVVQRLREFPEFELVFDTRSRVASVLLARCFLRHRVFVCCLPAYLLSQRRPPRRWSRPDSIAARALSMAEAAAGQPAVWQGSFAVSGSARALARQRLPDGPTYVGIAAGSRETRKNWPMDRYIALAQRLAETGRVPVVLVGPQEREILAELRRTLPHALFPEAMPVDPTLGLGRLELAMAICERLSAAVANDSGIGHLLGALQVPLVSLFGPTDAKRWRPYTACGTIIDAKQFGGTAMDLIPADAVFKAIETMIGPGQSPVVGPAAGSSTERGDPMRKSDGPGFRI
jgi:ADP-heptose:LPS heptosyltransferase